MNYKNGEELRDEMTKLLRIFLLVTLLLFFGLTEVLSKTIPVVDRKYFPSAQRIIKESKESISIAMFVAKRGEKVDNLIEELKKAAGRGVKIRVLLDDRLTANQLTKKFLEEKNIEARFDSPEKTTHNKIIISDEKIVLIGSTNWTEMSLGYANEANVMIEDRKMAEYFQEYFDYLWKDSSKDILPFKSFRGEIIPIIDREYFDVVQATMKKAKKRIWVMVYGFKLSSSRNTRADILADEMIKARKRGVKVRVILEKSDFNEWLNRMNGETIEYFKKNGIEARLDNKNVITHAKVVIIDDSVFLGSTNWSYGGLELWHNSDILIRNKKIVDFFVDYFKASELQ